MIKNPGSFRWLDTGYISCDVHTIEAEDIA